jgi:(2Fe-2S) ferredoxin
MPFHKPEFHLLVCNSFRVKGEAKGVCNRKDAPDLVQYLEEEIADRGLDAQVSTTGCMKLCDQGPVMVVYPHNWWYGEVDEERIDAILDSLESNTCREDLLIAG